MFCPKCGFDCGSDLKFCPKCGAALGQPAAPAASATGATNITESFANLGSKVGGTKQLFALICAASLFFSFLFSQIDNITAKFSAWGFSASNTGSMFEDEGFMRFLVIVFYLAAMALVVLPLFLKNEIKIGNAFSLKGEWGLINYIPAIVAPAVALVWMIIKIIDWNDDIGEYGSVSPSFVGWLFIICSVAAIGVAVKSILDSKK